MIMRGTVSKYCTYTGVYITTYIHKVTMYFYGVENLNIRGNSLNNKI